MSGIQPDHRPHYHNIPEQLIHPSVRHWVNFRMSRKPDGYDKVPLTPKGTNARSDDSGTWSSFQECVDAIHWGIGTQIGLALKGLSLVCIDIDHCFNPDGSASATAEKWLKWCGGKQVYCERSVSRTGLHILFWYTGSKLPSRADGAQIIADGFVLITGDVYADGH